MTQIGRIDGLRAAVLLIAASGLWIAPPASAGTPGQNCDWAEGFGLPGLDGHVGNAVAFNDGSGDALYIGGKFTVAGEALANGIAKWDGTSWSAVGAGMDPGVGALAVFDDGDGPALYAGGDFTTAGGVSANRIAKWDGTSWSALGSGMNDIVYDLAVFDDGGGAALYAGGPFTTAGGVIANGIAKWNGSSWSALGSGMNDLVAALIVFDDGGGPALYAGGDFTTAGGVSANRIAKWNPGVPGSWSPLGAGMNDPFSIAVSALAVFDDGGGPALYAGGYFTTAGGVSANRVAKWDGSSWSPLGSGVTSAVRALTVFDDGGGPALYVGGDFTMAGGREREPNRQMGRDGLVAFGDWHECRRFYPGGVRRRRRPGPLRGRRLHHRRRRGRQSHRQVESRPAGKLVGTGHRDPRAPA